MQEQANECKFAKLLAGARPKEHRFGPSKPLELDSQLELSLNQLVKPAEQIQTGSPTSGAPGVRIPKRGGLGLEVLEPRGILPVAGAQAQVLRVQRAVPGRLFHLSGS